MTAEYDTVDLALRSILQPQTRYERDFEIEPSKRATVGLNVGYNDEVPTIFNSQLSMTLFGKGAAEDEDLVAFEFYSEVRVEFEVRPGQEERLAAADDVGEILDHVRRLADPYHRQTLQDAMGRAGLPLLTLPLPQADGWRMSDEPTSTDE